MKSFSSNISTGKGTLGGHSKTSGFSSQIVAGQGKKIPKRTQSAFSDEIQPKIDKFQVAGGMAIVREQLAKSKQIKQRKGELEKALKLTQDAEELEKLGVKLSRIPTAFEYVIKEFRKGNRDEISYEDIATALHKVVENQALEETEAKILQIGWNRLYARAKSRGQIRYEYSARNLIPRGSNYHPRVGWY